MKTSKLDFLHFLSNKFSLPGDAHQKSMVSHPLGLEEGQNSKSLFFRNFFCNIFQFFIKMIWNLFLVGLDDVTNDLASLFHFTLGQQKPGGFWS